MKQLGGGHYHDDDAIRNAGFARVGRNVRIHTHAHLYGVENISIGDNVRIDDFTIIIATGPVTLGSHIHIATHCFLGGRHGIDMGDFSGLAPGVKLFTGSDDYTGRTLTNPTIPEEYTGGAKGKITLGRHAILGAGTMVMPRCVVAEGCAVGALSMVTKSLEPWGVYFGSPAKRVRERKKKLLELEKRFLEDWHADTPQP